jgi:uncharacterized protein (TIGR03435 family)
MRIVIAETAASSTIAPHHTVRPSPFDRTPATLWLLWSAGAGAILIRWFRRWRVAFGQAREGTPSNWPGLPMPVVSVPSALEPGVIGIIRPKLMLPAGIEEHLSPAQLQAVITHELCHVRHRDNLAAAVHMLVEALFWFHPLVWWMGARLMVERERACDEEVLVLGNDPTVYAQSIVRICQFCLESPVPCVSGITGADLRMRVGHIVAGQAGRCLGPAKKLLLASLAAAALAVPLAVGLLHPAKLRAQTAAPLHFEAASFKLSAGQDILEARPRLTMGRIRWKTQVGYLLEYAYQVEPWRIIKPQAVSLGPIYELEATMDPKATTDEVRLMLQSLLAERLTLTLHRETKEANGYALTVAKGGLKIEEAKEGSMPALPEWARRHNEDPANFEGLIVATMSAPGVVEINARRVTMLQLANRLERALDTAVLDRTGLSGTYYFGLQFNQGDVPDSPFPDLFGALQQLGLRLEKHQGPVEMLVIDRLLKEPVQN